LLDDAYQNFLRDLTPADNHSPPIATLAPESAQPTNSPPPVDEPPSFPRSPSLPLREPDFPHSILTIRLRPDTPPSSPSISPPSYSPINDPEELSRPSSPANFTSSVIPPPRPRHYYRYDPYLSLETLITQFPHRTDPLPPGSYTIGPDDFDPIEIRRIVATQDPDSIIPVFLPNSLFLMKSQYVFSSTFFLLQLLA